MVRPICVRTDFSADHLRHLSTRAETLGEARRLRAIAVLLEGKTRVEAARAGGMARQTLLDWVHRYNIDGPKGLASKKPPGRPAKLTPAQRRELALIVANGPDCSPCNPERWRLIDLTREIKQRFDVDIKEVSLSRALRRLGFIYDGKRWRASPGPREGRSESAPRHAVEAGAGRA